jgi:queuosine precursor transporter
MSLREIKLTVAYLVAIVLANLTAAWWGPQWTIINAFLFIGLDLSARDGLHELWGRGWHLAWRLGALIGTGSLISWLLNRNSGRIALASTVAFAAAALVDTMVFKWAHRLDRQDRANASNIAAALVDSVLFPTLAFGSFLLDVTVGQFGAKVAGGAIWVWIIWGWRKKEHAAAVAHSS